MRSEREEEHRGKLSLFRWNTFLLTAVTVASLGVGILGVFLTVLALKSPEAAVTFETISDTNVLDLRRPLEDLSIVFRGQNVQEQDLNLRILTIDIKNTGQVDILPNHYDRDDDWGMRVEDGEVIEARLVDSNSEYLKSKVVPELKGTDTVAFPKVIFEQGDIFTIEVLLLHPKNESPTIFSIGKIAGINNITVIRRPLSQEEIGIFERMFSGSPAVQVGRLIIYFIGSLIALITVIASIAGITSLIGKMRSRARRKRILRTTTMQQFHDQETRNSLADFYVENGLRGMREMRNLLANTERIKWFAPPARWSIDHDDSTRELLDRRGHMYADYIEFTRPRASLWALEKMKVLAIGEENEPIIDSSFVETLEVLVGDLEK